MSSLSSRDHYSSCCRTKHVDLTRYERAVRDNSTSNRSFLYCGSGLYVFRLTVSVDATMVVPLGLCAVFPGGEQRLTTLTYSKMRRSYVWRGTSYFFRLRLFSQADFR